MNKRPNLESLQKRGRVRRYGKQECQNCRYFHLLEPIDSPSGTCRRYPQSLNAMKDGWCGEWKAKRG